MSPSDPSPVQRRHFAWHILRIIIGIVFLASGIFKLIDIDIFELYLYGMQWFGFNFSSVLARLIISGELLLGVLLVGGIYFRKTRISAIVVIVLFSVFLAMRLFSSHSDENCNCFGEFIKMNPAESLIKNAALLLLLFFLRKHNGIRQRFQQSMLVFFSAFTLALPLILLPPDFLLRWDTPQQKFEEMAEKMSKNETLNTLNLAEGKKIVCFFSVTCPYCEMASKKVSVIAEKNGLQGDVIYIFAGNEHDLPGFWERGGSEQYALAFLSPRPFFDIAGPVVPSIFLTENGIPVTQYTYRTINENEIRQFFNTSDQGR